MLFYFFILFGVIEIEIFFCVMTRSPKLGIFSIIFNFEGPSRYYDDFRTLRLIFLNAWFILFLQLFFIFSKNVPNLLDFNLIIWSIVRVFNHFLQNNAYLKVFYCLSDNIFPDFWNLFSNELLTLWQIFFFSLNFNLITVYYNLAIKHVSRLMKIIGILRIP